MAKPRIFIGSSSGNIDVGNQIQVGLEQHADVTVWHQGVFEPTDYFMESLEKELDKADFGLFIFAPDDPATINGKPLEATRDNVVLELGMFIGKLGRKRCIVVQPNDVKDLRIPTNLKGIVTVGYSADRFAAEPRPAVGTVCTKISELILSKGQRYHPAKRQEFKIIPRKDFSAILVERMNDPKVKKIRMATYTTEVDVEGLRYNLAEGKEIEVYKRSVLSDLAEAQACNIRRISASSDIKPWDKLQLSKLASDLLEQTNSNIVQYFYDNPPSRRIFMFDESEAIIGYYAVENYLAEEGGSIYKGMSNEHILHIHAHSEIGRFILSELKNYFAGLQVIGRTWEQEKEILKGGSAWIGSGRRPCVRPKAVFFDLDGVLYDSLPDYVKAWQIAFDEIGEKFTEETVYREEGRRGKETVRLHLQKNRAPISPAIINKVYQRKCEVLRSLGPPKVMPGAVELVDAILDSDLEVLVVTGSNNIEHIGYLKTYFNDNLDSDKVISGDKTRAGKPDPDPYLSACHKLGIQPHEAIVIENAPHGITSADVAGTFCLALNTGPLEDDFLLQSGARAVFKDCQTLANCWPKVLEALKR